MSLICGQLNAAHADLIDLVTDLIEHESWAIGGIRSPEHWLTCFAGVSPTTARDLVRIAARSAELPLLSREVHSGRLSLGQATVVAAHTPTGYDQAVVDLAVHATVPQLRRALVKYDFATPTDEADTPPALPDPFSVAAQPAELSMWFDHDRFHLTYSAPADIGALVQQALAEAKDALFLATNTTDTKDDGRRVRMADAMEQLASRSLDAGTVTTAGRADKFRIYLHLDTTGQGWLTTRGALPPHLLRKWTCDGLVQPVWETGGTPVNVGRAHRIVPRRTRRLVEDRDRGCAYPGCLAIHHLECHHITHWADGGDTNMANLISLCPHHHDRHHTGDFTIHPERGRPGRFQFTTHHGHPIEPAVATAAPRATPAQVGPAPPRYTGPTNEILHLDQVRFHRRSSGPPG
ncbi:HNH endonuclease signature motif containing protein [Allobranchiibius sp. GilTou73]|uniref:HNH endonuclease signature motif containing protein n=1 Tax=Allobranchiibius sp. GilTou73 TaxID=2904523 RepID=UPI001F1B5F9B|nr:HNH endonuclease signature motif containing protein [Allobranchiibius sp. GilTou73]UIJ34546.1 HNH endonuclease [Allobranchiibius sp. GilTou73]